MKSLALLAVVSLAAAPSGSTRSSATAKRGKTAVTATTNRGKVRVSIRSGKQTSAITLDSPARCDAKRLSSVVARAVADNASAFGGLSMRGASLRLGSSWQDTGRFERGLGEILATGKYRAGVIEIPGFSMDLGEPPPSGKTTHPGSGREGSTTVTGLPGGGFQVVRSVTRGRGVSDTTTVTMNADGSSVIERVLGVGRGEGRVELTSRGRFDANGNRTDGSTDVGTEDGPGWTGKTGGLASGGTQSTQQPPSKADTQESGGGEQTSGGNDGGGDDQNEESPNPPTMASDGTFTAPALGIETELVASMVNWNRLGAAVTTPNPMNDGRGDVGEHEGGLGTNVGGPCTHLDDPGFEPNPKFLRPSKQGWVTDPRPALRGR